jgi:hypothetical protein
VMEHKDMRHGIAECRWQAENWSLMGQAAWKKRGAPLRIGGEELAYAKPTGGPGGLVPPCHDDGAGGIGREQSQEISQFSFQREAPGLPFGWRLFRSGVLEPTSRRLDYEARARGESR